LCSMVSMTSSILPVNTCLAMLSVKLLAVAAGTWEGRQEVPQQGHATANGQGALQDCEIASNVGSAAEVMDGDNQRRRWCTHLA